MRRRALRGWTALWLCSWLDVGPSSWNRIALWRIPGERIGAVLLTHFPSDPIGELGEWKPRPGSPGDARRCA